MSTKDLINFLRDADNPQSLPLTGDPQLDRHLLKEAGERKWLAYQAAMRGAEGPERRKSRSERFRAQETPRKDPPMYRDFLQLEEGTLLELIRDPDHHRLKFVCWEEGTPGEPNISYINELR